MQTLSGLDVAANVSATMSAERVYLTWFYFFSMMQQHSNSSFCVLDGNAVDIYMRKIFIENFSIGELSRNYINTKKYEDKGMKHFSLGMNL